VLRIGRVGTGLRRHGSARDSCIARVVAAIHGAIAIGRAARRTGNPVAYTAGLPSAVLTALACLAALPRLARLSIAGELAGLKRLPGLTLSGLALSRLPVGPPAQAVELVAQPRQIIHRAIERGFFGTAFRPA